MIKRWVNEGPKLEGCILTWLTFLDVFAAVIQVEKSHNRFFFIVSCTYSVYIIILYITYFGLFHRLLTLEKCAVECGHCRDQ